MRQFPAFFNLPEARIALFGDGEEAVRKLRLFEGSGAHLMLIGASADLVARAGYHGQHRIWARSDAGRALEGARLAIIAEPDPLVRRAALKQVRARAIPVNVVDSPSDCDFTVPSIVDRGEIVAAIGTGGGAPVLARLVRARLEALLPWRTGELVRLAASLRSAVADAIPDRTARRLFWERALRGPAAEAALAGDEARARSLFMEQARAQGAGRGCVHIVGAGPGDPELLTLKALRLIQEADIVYYDNLVSEAVISLIRRDAARICVGKSRGGQSVAQEDIHSRLIGSARQGLRVVRLKGGDPFIFGRGGEEMEALRDAGIEVHLVPGISAALGCAASAGIPLTHREHARALTLVTGHSRQGGVPELDWDALAHPDQTLVVFMGVLTAREIAARLMAHGRDRCTPVAVIVNGTRPEEVRLYGTLGELGPLASGVAHAGPALLIIGEVVGQAALRDAAISSACQSAGRAGLVAAAAA